MASPDSENKASPSKKRRARDNDQNAGASKRLKSKKNVAAESDPNSPHKSPAGNAVADKETPHVLILVGLQGSGKSTFAARLEREGWATVSQDEKGKKRWKCETQAVAFLRSGMSVVIDRCNFDEAQRSHWIKIAKKLQCIVGCVVFAVPIAVCIERVQNRKNHKTLPPGEKSVGIIRSTAKAFRPPLKSEGLMFCRTVRNHSDIERVFSEVITGIVLRT